MYGSLKKCVFCRPAGGPGTGRRNKNSILGRVGREFRSIGSRYVQWNPLDSSKTIENLLLEKVAILLRIVAFLASSEKLVGALKKSCHSSEKKSRFVI